MVRLFCVAMVWVVSDCTSGNLSVERYPDGYSRMYLGRRGGGGGVGCQTRNYVCTSVYMDMDMDMDEETFLSKKSHGAVWTCVSPGMPMAWEMSLKRFPH